MENKNIMKSKKQRRDTSVPVGNVDFGTSPDRLLGSDSGLSQMGSQAEMITTTTMKKPKDDNFKTLKSLQFWYNIKHTQIN